MLEVQRPGMGIIGCPDPGLMAMGCCIPIEGGCIAAAGVCTGTDSVYIATGAAFAGAGR